MSGKKKTYEEAMAELEEIISEMEKGSVPLDKSIEYFKKGADLIKYCEGLLDEYDKMITKVTEGEDGKPEEEEI